MKRGEVWVAAGGADYAGKPRPVVVVQADRFDATRSVTICPFTTDATDLALIRPLVEPDAQNGLAAPSRLMVDKMTTMARTKLSRCVGTLNAKDSARLDRAIIDFLDLTGALPRAFRSAP